MKKPAFAHLGVLVALVLNTWVQADTFVPSQAELPNVANPEATIANIKIEEPASAQGSASDQLLGVQIGGFHPKSTQISNGSYSFDYGAGNSFFGELGWALKLYQPLHGKVGTFYFEEGLAFSDFSGSAAQSSDLQLSSNSYSLYLFGLDTRLMYAADWFPWKILVPFGDAGYQYTLYYQPGSSGLESADGGVGNFVAGGGARIWLNPGVLASGGHPVFVTAKVNRIFPNSGALDLGSLSVLGGLTLGL